MMDSESEGRTVTEQFARNLVRCRERAGLNQAELASRAGLDRAHVSILEHAGRHPQIDTVVKLAGALGVEPGELLRGMTWKPSKIREGKFRVDDDPAPD
jgi:transcriptional regulator with XRE-family HTH domain